MKFGCQTHAQNVQSFAFQSPLSFRRSPWQVQSPFCSIGVRWTLRNISELLSNIFGLQFTCFCTNNFF